ncbi:MAG: ribulose-phosphate 3-epimerase [Bradymonadaceae bacterium]|nr:ribulose-phosphate 3-epimerase [Lujinxingiaceae bacterium]
MTKSSNFLIAPSILASDFTRLGDECQAVLEAGVDWLHIDVMDGHYVPNITIGLPVVQALRKRFPNAYLDVHLMISNPDQFIEPFVEAGANLVSFHPEVSHHPHRAIQRIQAAGARAGLAINPGTALETIDYLIEDIDLVLVMSVNPGFGGQKFVESSLRKLRELQALLDQRGLSIDVEVDGGVGVNNIAQIRDAGANVFVAGSAIFGSPSYAETIGAMRKALAVSQHKPSQ